MKTHEYIIFGLCFVVIVLVLLCLNNNRPSLMDLASEKMEVMKKDQELSHSNGDCDFDCRTRGMSRVGENLYKGDCDLEYAMKLWKESPTHKEILDLGFKDMVILGEQSGEYCYITYNVHF